MEDRDIYRVFEQVKPTGSQEEAMLERLFSEERKGRPMKLMKKTIAVLAAAALLLMTCAFAAVTGLDRRLLNNRVCTSECLSDTIEYAHCVAFFVKIGSRKRGRCIVFRKKFLCRVQNIGCSP